MKIRLAVSALMLVLAAGVGPATATALAPSGAVSHAKLAPLPKHFPMPPHAVVVKEHFKGRNDAYELKVASLSAAMRFWARALPKHGWTVRRAHLTGPLKYIFFHGHGDGKGKYTGKNINRTMINTLGPGSHRVAVTFHSLR